MVAAVAAMEVAGEVVVDEYMGLRVPGEIN